jgi:hypothetical protein
MRISPERESAGETCGGADRLTFKFLRLVEGQAEGRPAITALVIVALAVLFCWTVLQLFFLLRVQQSSCKRAAPSRSAAPRVVSSTATQAEGDSSASCR